MCFNSVPKFGPFFRQIVSAAFLYKLLVERRKLLCRHRDKGGGGRRNPSLMAALRSRLPAPVEPVELVGWRGDALEAQAFGFLAVRSLKGLPLSLPSTTGVRRPTTGGVLHRP